MAETNIKKYGTINPFASGYIKAKIKKTWLNNGYDHPMHNHAIASKTIVNYTYDNKNFDSSWELALYIWLKDNNIQFEY